MSKSKQSETPTTTPVVVKLEEHQKPLLVVPHDATRKEESLAMDAMQGVTPDAPPAQQEPPPNPTKELDVVPVQDAQDTFHGVSPDPIRQLDVVPIRPQAPREMTEPHQPRPSTTITTTSSPQTEAQEEEKAKTSAGQRAVNIMWERTQAFIALMVVTVWAGTSAWMIVMGEGADKQVYFSALSSTTLLVIGFYFGRTNHQRTGGVGQEISGR